MRVCVCVFPLPDIMNNRASVVFLWGLRTEFIFGYPQKGNCLSFPSWEEAELEPDISYVEIDDR